MSRWAGVPLAIFLGEFKASKVPNDARHRHGAFAPWWAEVEIELVVLHICIASDIMLYSNLPSAGSRRICLTYSTELSSTQMLSNCFRD